VPEEVLVRTLTALLLLGLAIPAPALEVRIHPGQDGLYVYEVDARRGLSTAMIQNLAVVQRDGVPIALADLSIELRAGDRVRQVHRFDQADLAAAAGQMDSLQKAGVLDLYDFVFQRRRYLGEKTSLAPTETVAAGTALVLGSIPLLVSRGVDSMRIVARGIDAEGRSVEASLVVPLVQRNQRNDYRFPVRGAWLVAVGPGLSEPHRWALNEEFALDLVRVGASGKTCSGNCAKLADYTGWGADVIAAADGEVVSAVTDQKETSERLRKPGESSDAFLDRTVAEQQKLLARGAAGVGGNSVVIRHEGGEFSFYGHLAEGSVAAKVGEKVKRGQRVGKLGQTGNSTEPHLHFGILDGPDPLYARSLPVRFGGLTTPDGPQPPVFVQSGWLVEAK
jgi:hypothetical protein